MNEFHYLGSALYCEKVPLSHVAQAYGTPCYVYSRKAIESSWRIYEEAFRGHPHLLCYAVKANANLGILHLLSRLGSGFDIVSLGELERVLYAGGDPSRIIFSGVGKREDEMQRALEVGIRCFNVESEPELLRLDRIARSLGQRAPVAVRINPDIDANTHPYIATGLKESKFGVAVDPAIELYHAAARMPALSIVGAACHIGSQLLSISPLMAAFGQLLKLVRALNEEGIPVRHLDLGGGLGIQYQDEQPPSPREYVEAILGLVPEDEFEIVLAPGRSILGPAGVLLTRVEFIKRTVAKSFAIVDAAMTEFLRPALYNAQQGIVPVQKREEGAPDCYDVVGPVCESGDFLGKDRWLNVHAGDLLAVQAAGAYGFCLSSNYNARPRPPEVIIDGETVHTVREREHLIDLWRGEALIGDFD